MARRRQWCGNLIERKSFCPVCTENLNAGVIVMQSTEERMGVNGSRSLNRARDRRILIQ